MASLILSTSFFLVICMHSYNARLLPAIVKPSSEKSHHHSISLQVAEKMVESTRAQVRPPATPFSKAEFGPQNGSDIVESSSSHLVDMLKGKHVEAPDKAIVSRNHGKEEVNHSENGDILVTDYQPPHRKTPIHNK